MRAMDTTERLPPVAKPPVAKPPAAGARAAWRWAANGATVCILGLGLLAAALAVAGGPPGRGTVPIAAIRIVLAALIDGADGALARRAGGPTRAGAILDILADLSAFGLAPAALAAAGAAAGAPEIVWPLVLALSVYLAAALWRLVRSARLAFSKPAGWYVGLPMPTAGCLLAGLVLNLPPIWVSAAVLVISLLGVSRRPYPSVPWMWQQRPASLLAFVVVSAVVMALAPSAGLLVAAGVCAAYPWVRPVL
jgi:CDP-diacylglycerol---serine O-phosphatidyltransferase